MEVWLWRRTLIASIICGAIITSHRASDAAIVVSPQLAPPAGGRAIKPIPQPAIQPSKITLNLDLPLNKIQTFINKMYKVDFNEPQNHGIIHDLKLKVGTIALSSSGDEVHPIRLSAPFVATGSIIFKGLDFNLAGQASIDLGTDFGSDWCPGPTYANLKIDFTSDSTAITGGRSIGDFLDPITYFVKRDLDQTITCDNFKKALANIWTERQWAFEMMRKKFVLTADPKDLSLSNVKVIGDRVTLVATLSTTMNLSTRESLAKKVPLPDKITPVASPSQAPADRDLDGSFRGTIDLDAR